MCFNYDIHLHQGEFPPCVHVDRCFFTRRVSSIAVKGTELNAEKGLVTKCIQEIKFILSLSEILAKVAFYQEKPKVELTG